MRRFGWMAIALVFSVLIAAPAAYAEKRIALLIGNQAYGSEIGRLANPHNDVALLEKALKDLQFEVTTVRDAGLAALHQTVNTYVRRVRAAGQNAVAFFYYSGHGASDANTNYLIPVDVKSVEDSELWDQSLRLTEITRKLKVEAGNATHFVVFDACRNTLKLKMAGSRALVQPKGFVPVAQESGMLIAYATAEGELASDLGVDAGPYAKVLAEEIVKPGIEAVVMFRIVQRRVRAAIKQEPYLGFNALGDVYLAGLEPPKSPQSQAASPAQSQSAAAEAWPLVRDTTSVSALEAYIRRHGDTVYGDLARVRLDEVKKAMAEQQRLPLPDQQKQQGGTKARIDVQRLERIRSQIAIATSTEFLDATLRDEPTLKPEIEARRRQLVGLARGEGAHRKPVGPESNRLERIRSQIAIATSTEFLDATLRDEPTLKPEIEARRRQLAGRH